MSAIVSVEQLKARCTVDPATHCWLWLGGTSRGRPYIYTLDYAKTTKHGMDGPRAAYNIGMQTPLRHGEIVARGMSCPCLCVNPAHVRRYASRALLRAAEGASGRSKGSLTAGRARSLKAAWAKRPNGVVPAEVVSAIRQAPKEVTCTALAQTYRRHVSTISKIRRAASQAGVSARPSGAITAGQLAPT